MDANSSASQLFGSGRVTPSQNTCCPMALLCSVNGEPGVLSWVVICHVKRPNCLYVPVFPKVRFKWTTDPWEPFPQVQFGKWEACGLVPSHLTRWRRPHSSWGGGDYPSPVQLPAVQAGRWVERPGMSWNTSWERMVLLEVQEEQGSTMPSYLYYFLWILYYFSG